MTTKTRFGIVGLALGHPLGFARELAAQGFVPRYLCIDDTQEEELTRSRQMLGEWDELELVDSPRAMIEAGVDAVLCSSQSHRHLDDCSELIKKRVPLFIDKPMAPDYPQGRAILDLVEKYDAPMMSCSVRRFSENYNAVFAAMAEGKLGTALFVECFEPHGTKPGYWQDVKSASGGLAVNYGVHVVDPIVAALGTEVVSVHAFGAKRAKPEVDSEDTAVLQVQFADGTIAIGKCSGGYEYGKNHPVPTVGHFICHATKGCVQAFIDESDVTVYRGGSFGVTPGYHRKAGNLACLAAFVEMVKTGKRPVPIAQMDAVMKILDAARQSIDTGRAITFD